VIANANTSSQFANIAISFFISYSVIEAAAVQQSPEIAGVPRKFKHDFFKLPQ
jgi:hypothetical protein